MVEAVNASVRLRSGNIAPFKRILIVVSPPGSVSECLFPALEREFSWISIKQVENVEGACVKFEHPVSLILVDFDFLEDIHVFSRDISKQHPTSITAIMYDDRSDAGTAIEDIMASRTVRSVLPMNLRLDLWLSVIRLMLRGGEYFPTSFIQNRLRADMGKADDADALSEGPQSESAPR